VEHFEKNIYIGERLKKYIGEHFEKNILGTFKNIY